MHLVGRLHTACHPGSGRLLIMSFFIRKISRAKWETEGRFASGQIPADAVTADLRTRNNSMSLWHIDKPSNDNELCDIALAFVAAADRIETMDLAWVDKEFFESNRIIIESSDGRTPVVSLRQYHADAINVDLTRLSAVATGIAAAIKINQYKRFTKRELKKIIVDAIDKELISIDVLNQKVKEEIRKQIHG